MDAEQSNAPARVAERAVTPAESAHANRLWWDANAADYYDQHGDVLGDADLLWCPEGLRESDVHLLGPTADLVTHRITQITADGIHTKGDANRTADVWTIPRSYVEGVVSWRLPGVGFAVVFLQQPLGIASIVIAFIGLILLWQLFFPATPTVERPAGELADAAPEDPHEEPDGHVDDQPSTAPDGPEAACSDDDLERESVLL